MSGGLREWPAPISPLRGRRVALLTAAGPWSGVEVHTLSLAKALKAAGHAVVIVELGRDVYSSDAPEAPPCEVIRLDIGPGPSPPLESVSFSRWLRLFGSVDCDVAVAAKGVFKFGTLAMEVAARSRFKRFYVIEHLHAPLGARGSQRYLGGLLRGVGLWWYRGRLSGFLRSLSPHKVICVSNALVTTLREDYGYPAAKLVTAYSGIDTHRFKPDADARSALRRDWGVPESALVFGTIGRVSRMKNHAQLLRAFARLRDRLPDRDIRLAIVGDGPERASLEALVATLGQGDRVILPGFLPRPETVAPAFDVFCFPSLTGESLGLALLEAMACGVPAIGSAVGGVPEILTAPAIGWLIPPDREDALLDTMQTAASISPECLRTMGQAARAHVVQHFEAETKWRELVEVICH